MIHFKFSDKDPRYLFLVPDNDIDLANCRELLAYTNLVNPVCFLPQYKGQKFTDDYIWEYRQSSGKVIFYTAIGMWQEIYKFFKANNIEYDGLDPNRFKRNVPHTFEEFCEIVKSWNLKYDPRPYQLECAYNILCWNRSISQMATRSGKTMTSYIIFRYCREFLGAHNILMVVPSIDLVKQGFQDFEEYGEYFQTECIWAGGKLVESADMTIGTFQSLIKFLDNKSKKYNPHWFDKFDIVFVDEVHRATAAQTKTIISQPFMKDVKIAFGMTGTLPQEHTSERFSLASLLGAKIQTITPKELMDSGYISKLKIYQYRISYKNEEKQLDTWIKCAEYVLSDYVTIFNEKTKKEEKVELENPYFLFRYKKTLPQQILSVKQKIFSQSLLSEIEKKLEYKKLLQKYISLSSKGNGLVVERMMVHFFNERIDFLINDILPQCHKNTLILAHHTSYISCIYELLKKSFPNRHVECVYGAVSPKKRAEIREMMKTNNDVILIASYACMGTGLTLANLCYGVFLESFKSNVINMQSIGRGLGLSNQKDKYILYDLVDSFDQKLASKRIFLQGIEKTKIFKENSYEYEVVNIDLPKVGDFPKISTKNDNKKIKNKSQISSENFNILQLSQK